MMRSIRRGAAAAVVSAIGLAAGCEARTKAIGGKAIGSAQVVATLLTPGLALKSEHHTVLLMKSIGRRFRVLTGPLDAQWFALSGRNPGAQVPDAYTMVGSVQNSTAGATVQNSDPVLEIDQGYALAWGYWPVAWTKTVSIGADGSTLLVVVEGTTEYLVLVDGLKATIRKRATLDPSMPELATITDQEYYVKVVGGAIVAGPIPVPTDPMDPLRAMLNSAKARQAMLEP